MKGFQQLARIFYVKIYICILSCPLLDVTQAEAYDILKKCILEIQKRLIVNLNNFKVAIVDRDGSRRLDDITSKSLIDYVP